METRNWYEDLKNESRGRGIAMKTISKLAGFDYSALSYYRDGRIPNDEFSKALNKLLKNIGFDTKVPSNGKTRHELAMETAEKAREHLKEARSMRKAVKTVGTSVEKKNVGDVHELIFIEAMKAVVLGRYGTGLPVTPREVVEIAYGIADEASVKMGRSYGH
jgi:hypothetical protein